MITRNSTVLIDDDINNVEIALRNQVRAIWLNPQFPNRILSELQCVADGSSECSLPGVAQEKGEETKISDDQAATGST
jgi:hypothetical protein